MPLQTKQSTTPDHPPTCLPTNRYPSRCPRSFALCPASCSLSISLPFTPLHSTSPSIPVPQCPFLPQYNPPTHLQLNSSDTPYPPPQPSDAALSPFRSPTSHLPFPSATNKRAPLPAPPCQQHLSVHPVLRAEHQSPSFIIIKRHHPTNA